MDHHIAMQLLAGLNPEGLTAHDPQDGDVHWVTNRLCVNPWTGNPVRPRIENLWLDLRSPRNADAVVRWLAYQYFVPTVFCCPEWEFTILGGGAHWCLGMSGYAIAFAPGPPISAVHLNYQYGTPASTWHVIPGLPVPTRAMHALPTTSQYIEALVYVIKWLAQEKSK